MANLFEINKDLVAAWEAAVDPETGEVDPDLLVIFEGLQLERDTKIENLACWVKNLKSDSEALKAEAKAMTDRARAAENKAESIKNYLAAALNGQKFQSPKAAIGWRKSTQVEIAPDATLPPEFIRVKHVEEPAKDEIKKALKAGVAVPGCELIEKNNISIK